MILLQIPTVTIVPVLRRQAGASDSPRATTCDRTARGPADLSLILLMMVEIARPPPSQEIRTTGVMKAENSAPAQTACLMRLRDVPDMTHWRSDLQPMKNLAACFHLSRSTTPPCLRQTEAGPRKTRCANSASPFHDRIDRPLNAARPITSVLIGRESHLLKDYLPAECSRYRSERRQYPYHTLKGTVETSPISPQACRFLISTGSSPGRGAHRHHGSVLCLGRMAHRLGPMTSYEPTDAIRPRQDDRIRCRQ